ncbi:hypothetical protein D3C72_1791710 [compost metagenome]
MRQIAGSPPIVFKFSGPTTAKAVALKESTAMAVRNNEETTFFFIRLAFAKPVLHEAHYSAIQ